MRRILSLVSNNIESGGVESYLLNAYKNMDLKGILIDILVPGKIVYEEYADEFKRLGCNLIPLNISCGGMRRLNKLYDSFLRIMKEKKYDIVHVNTGNLTIEAVALKCATIANIPVRVAHSHGTVYLTGKVQEIVRTFLRLRINKYATHKLACSTAAAEALFGKGNTEDAVIAKNGIDSDKYVYDFNEREAVRAENGWGDSFVIGSVGRLAPEKNYSFVIQVFAELHKNCPNSRLVLIGDGEEKTRLEEEAKYLNVQTSVEFLGIRKDVSKLMQGLDVFVLASKREALGIVNIEAQATGLPCVVSDVIPKEIDLTGMVCFISLEDSIETWTEAILRYRNIADRKGRTDIVKEKGYDFSTSYDLINKIYHINLADRR